MNTRRRRLAKRRRKLCKLACRPASYQFWRVREKTDYSKAEESLTFAMRRVCELIYK